MIASFCIFFVCMFSVIITGLLAKFFLLQCYGFWVMNFNCHGMISYKA